MKNTTRMVLALLLCAAATPALADWDNIGSVNVDFGRDRDTKDFRLGGPVERLQLTADGSDIACRSVRADLGRDNGRDNRMGPGNDRRGSDNDRRGFGNDRRGGGTEIFSGTLRRGQATNIDLPGEARTLAGLTFNCTAMDRRGGVIRIVADVGHYRGDWQRGPDWQRSWSRMFNWGSNAINDWQMIGSESFEGRGDTESSFAGLRGRGADAVALKPLEADARCVRVRASFGNRGTQNLDVNRGDVLRRGQFYKLDLPGDRRNLQSLTLNCRAEGARRVTIQLFVSK